MLQDDFFSMAKGYSVWLKNENGDEVECIPMDSMLDFFREVMKELLGEITVE